MTAPGSYDGRILDIKHATIYRGDTCVFEDLSFVLEKTSIRRYSGQTGQGSLPS